MDSPVRVFPEYGGRSGMSSGIGEIGAGAFLASGFHVGPISPDVNFSNGILTVSIADTRRRTSFMSSSYNHISLSCLTDSGCVRFAINSVAVSSILDPLIAVYH